MNTLTSEQVVLMQQRCKAYRNFCWYNKIALSREKLSRHIVLNLFSYPIRNRDCCILVVQNLGRYQLYTSDTIVFFDSFFINRLFYLSRIKEYINYSVIDTQRVQKKKNEHKNQQIEVTGIVCSAKFSNVAKLLLNWHMSRCRGVHNGVRCTVQSCRVS